MEMCCVMIGCGAFGRVYMGMNLDSGELLAVKQVQSRDRHSEHGPDRHAFFFKLSELTGHCTTREPNQRPNMGHAVNVLSPLMEKWKPMENEAEKYCGIDY
ncbi:hypothetical protein L6452_09143 [Arctium lappa]|uniref:Uncharacterized protein n=1 Tax=Arctium lappa TaxID=4217 RepID=A0ACB9DJ82_ARCLA|nr:hypothetical protein L6452_09143 [Arctium lappa]